MTIAAHHNGLNRDQSHTATARVVQSYREAMSEFAGIRSTDIWDAHIDEDDYVAYADSNGRSSRLEATSPITVKW